MNRIRFIALLCASLLLLSACTPAAEQSMGTATAPEGEQQTEEAMDEATTEQVSEKKSYTFTAFSEEEQDRLSDIADVYGPTAFQVAFLDKDTIYTYCRGYAEVDEHRKVTDNTKYRIASLSKLITAMVYMAAQDRGLADKDTDISEYFGEPVYNPRFKKSVITPSLLMTHLASVGSDTYYVLQDGMLTWSSFYYYSEPGTEYAYSNTGYGVLSCMLERITEQPFPDLAAEFLFEPLGIDAAYTWDRLKDGSDIGALYGEGGMTVNYVRKIKTDPLGKGIRISYGNLLISAKDYVQLLGVLINDGCDISGKRILSSEAVEQMLERRFTEGMFGVAFGSQIQTNVIEGTKVYVHTGSAAGMFSTYVFDPEAKKAAVVVSTGEGRRMDPETEVYRLCQDLIREVWNEEKDENGIETVVG